jgi:hypothetical protein
LLLSYETLIDDFISEMRRWIFEKEEGREKKKSEVRN